MYMYTKTNNSKVLLSIISGYMSIIIIINIIYVSTGMRSVLLPVCLHQRELRFVTTCSASLYQWNTFSRSSAASVLIL